ncbi:hypothetical protein Tco_0482126 [Tanacetum coccineum]
MFDTDDLHGDEVIVDMAVGEKQEKSAKIDEREVSTGVEDSVAPTIPVTTADEGVTAAKIDEITPTSAPTTVIDELTLAQTLIEIKAAKPKVVTTAATTTTTRPKARGVVVQEPSEFRTTTSSPQASQPSKTKDKGKAIMIEPEVPLKRKDQVALDEEMARNLEAQLQAELIEEEKMARKKEEEANIALIESWENTQAMMEADRLLAERLQTREQEELTDEEKAKLFMEFMEKRRKHFAALRAQEKRNRPPTKVQKRNQMSIYLKHMGGYKHNQLKGRSYDEIQKLFDKEMKRVNSFVAMNSEAQEISGKKDESSSKKTEIAQDSSAKRAGDKLESDKSKKQKTDENEEVEVDNEAELKMHMVIVKDDDIAIDAIPLATKPPMIVEYKIIKEGIIGHYQLIRADGSSKRYSSMIRMLQGIDREDLETLWKLVKTKHGNTRPEDEHERVLWGDLKVMFEPDIKSDVWRNLQGYKVTIWKLFDSCGVHFVSYLDDAEMFDTDDLHGDEVIVDMAVGEKQEQSAKVDEREVSTGVEDSVAPTIPVTTAGEGVTATKIDEITTTSAPTTTIDEITLAQTLIKIKAAKPKAVTTAATTTTTRPKARGVVVQEPSEFRTTTSSPQASQPSKTKDKGKAIMIEPEVPLKRKDQVALDEEMARNLEAQLQAELIEEEKMARKKEEEANIALIESWENTQAMIEADRLLAERLQTREQEELTDEEKAKLFMEFMEKRRKHFTALRAQEKRNRPPTKAQKRNQMSVYLKHMGGYKHNQLKGRSYDEIQKLFDKEMKRVKSFMAMNSEAQEISGKKDECSSKKTEIAQDCSAKRAGDKLESDESKKQKTVENEEVEEDNEAELKKHLVIVKDDDIAIDVIPLDTKPPVIVEYKLIKEGIIGHYQLIRADGSSKRYSFMIRML